MKKLRNIFLLLLIAAVSLPAVAQRTYTITGTVVDPYDGSPIEGAVVSATNLGQSVTTDANGTFKAELSSLKGELNVWYPGYYTKVIPVNGRTSFSVILIPEDKYGYTDYVLTPNAVTPGQDKNTNTYSRQSKDFTASTVDVEKTFVNIPGLYVAEKSGMPGEGSYFQIRGNRTANATGMPLIVLNGQPYFGSLDASGVVNGYSTSLFSALNAQDIASVSVLKGADAAKYGSLAANGVIAIETERAIDLETQVEFIGQYGVDLNQSKLPTLNVKDYKNYVSALGLTDGTYEDMDDMLVDFPYLSQDPSVYVNPHLYTNNTDWQDEIYSPGFVTDNTLKIKGGDAIAKYDLSVGYKRKEGQVKNTDYNRYYARLNSDINLSRNLVFTSSLSLAYINSNLQEQGLSRETNPLLAALAEDAQAVRAHIAKIKPHKLRDTQPAVQKQAQDAVIALSVDAVHSFQQAFALLKRQIAGEGLGRLGGVQVGHRVDLKLLRFQRQVFIKAPDSGDLARARGGREPVALFTAVFVFNAVAREIAQVIIDFLKRYGAHEGQVYIHDGDVVKLRAARHEPALDLQITEKIPQVEEILIDCGARMAFDGLMIHQEIAQHARRFRPVVRHCSSPRFIL